MICQVVVSKNLCVREKGHAGLHNVGDYTERVAARAIKQERARLVAGVGKLTESRHVVGYPEGRRWVRKSAVLALIRDTEGGTE